MLDPVIHKMITYVQNLEEKDLKDKVVIYTSSNFKKKRTEMNVFTVLLVVLPSTFEFRMNMGLVTFVGTCQII